VFRSRTGTSKLENGITLRFWSGVVSGSYGNAAWGAPGIMTIRMVVRKSQLRFSPD